MLRFMDGPNIKVLNTNQQKANVEFLMFKEQKRKLQLFYKLRLE